MINIVKKFQRLFRTRYPGIPTVYPYAFDSLRAAKLAGAVSPGSTMAIQLVQDRLYFMLFGAIAWKLRKRGVHRVDALATGSVNGAVGTGWRVEKIRSAPITKLVMDRWLRAFGDTVDGIGYRSTTWQHPISDMADWTRAGRHWHDLQNCPDIASYAIDGIQIGDLVIDSYLRFRPSPEFNVTDPFVRRLLWQALRDVRVSTRYFRRARPRLYLTSYSTYFEHGIPARVALKNGVKVWSFGNLNTFGKELTLEDNYHTRDASEYRRIFDSLDDQDERLEAARVQLETRLSGGIDTATQYMKKSAYTEGSAPLPDGLDGAVVVFLHDFYDSPHVYADIIFNDFWQWICFTIETLQQAGIAFFLKPHPNQIALSDGALDLLKKKYPDLRWLDSSISNARLAKAGMACGVTVYGTIAHELAYLGVPSIGCARHPHHVFDFCRTAKNLSEYRDLLQSSSVRPTTDEEMRRQALAFYYMHNLYGPDDERQLQRAFVEFWSLCNGTQASEEEILTRFHEFVELPGFAQLVEDMAIASNAKDKTYLSRNPPVSTH